MLESFIINGKKEQLCIRQKIFHQEPLEVTSHSENVRSYIASGIRLITLLIINSDVEEIWRTYEVLNYGSDIWQLKTIE